MYVCMVSLYEASVLANSVPLPKMLIIAGIANNIICNECRYRSRININMCSFPTDKLEEGKTTHTVDQYWSQSKKLLSNNLHNYSNSTPHYILIYCNTSVEGMKTLHVVKMQCMQKVM